MIEFINVTKVYEQNHHALREVSFSVKAGEMVSIVGQSGAGKSTIVKLLTGEEKVNRGQIIVGGWDITDLNEAQIPVLRRQIGVVYQDYRLLPHKTVYENVAFALEVCGVAHKRIAEVVPQVLKIVGLKDMTERFPHQLSGGEKQRVAIARALIHRPKMLLADEPTGNLDTVNTQDIIHLLERINEFGTTIVLVTHDKDVVNSLNKRVITLEHGKLIKDVQHGKYAL